MSETKKNTLNKILRCARDEFLSKGYKDASLRSVVKTAGVTTGAVYGYFKDKESLFEALVGEAANNLKNQFLESQKEFKILNIDEKAKIVIDYSSEQMDAFVDYIYDNYDSFKLIVCSSKGTKFENYIDELIEIEEDYTYAFVCELVDKGYKRDYVNKELIHMLTSSLFTGVFEVVAHDMNKEHAKRYIIQLFKFFSAGWKELLIM